MSGGILKRMQAMKPKQYTYKVTVTLNKQRPDVEVRKLLRDMVNGARIFYDDWEFRDYAKVTKITVVPVRD